MRTRLLRLSVLAASGAAVALVACGFSFQNSSTVIDQRILAIEADPPQLTAGASGTIQFTALIVDPRTTNPVSFQLRACQPAGLGGGVSRSNSGLSALSAAQGDQETLANAPSIQLCPDDTPLAASGTQSLGDVTMSIALPSALARLLAGASGPDGGVALPADAGIVAGETVGLVEADLRATDPGGTDDSVLTIPVTPILAPGDTVNHNPQLSGVTFDGATWADGVPVQIPYGSCTMKAQLRFGQANSPTGCPHTIAPVYDDDQSEAYHQAQPDGGWEPERERLTFYWYTDQGSFNRAATAQQIPGSTSSDAQLPVTWNEPSSRPSGPVSFWFIIRDGRGGQSWIERQVDFE